jgi:YfiH family protein
MEWHEQEAIEWLQADLPRAKVVFATRSSGSLKESSWLLTDVLGIDPEHIVNGRQVHGAGLAYHDAPPTIGAPRPTAPPEVDGHVLTRPGPVGLVYTADCLPVALAGPGGAAILHCGWRGLAAGIVANGVEVVGAAHAAIGPGIGACCYEVGDEVLAAFAHLGDGVASGRMLDLAEVARRLLGEAGVGSIESADLCTRCEEELFFSHRRDGGPGRQGGLAWLDGEVR